MSTAAKLEFALILARETEQPNEYATVLLASRLMRASKTLHRLAEESCNTGSEEIDRRIEVRQKSVQKLLRGTNITPIFSGDPRGAVLKLHLPRTKTHQRLGRGRLVRAVITLAQYCKQPDFGCDRETRETYAAWIVTPFSRHRDSDCLEESNFHVALARMGDEGDHCTVLRFGHWAVGWVEHILVRPQTAAYLTAERLAAKLDSYPILDEDDYSEREAGAE